MKMSYWRNGWLEKSSLRMCPNCLVEDTPLLFGWGSAHSGSALGGNVSQGSILSNILGNGSMEESSASPRGIFRTLSNICNRFFAKDTILGFSQGPQYTSEYLSGANSVTHLLCFFQLIILLIHQGVQVIQIYVSHVFL